MKHQSNQDDCMLSIYDVPENLTINATIQPNEETGRASKMKKNKNQNVASENVKIPLNVSYLCLNDSNKNIIYGTNDSHKFSIDIRTPKQVTYFIDENKDTLLLGKEDSMVEYNQNNYITFANRLQKNILIFDVRQVS